MFAQWNGMLTLFLPLESEGKLRRSSAEADDAGVFTDCDLIGSSSA